MKLIVHRAEDVFYDVLLLKLKYSHGYSFVNLTKQHICPCVFYSIEEALSELENRKKTGRIIDYKIIDE